MLERFKLRENNTSVSTEFFGGLSSFLASFYIIIVNPSILSQAGLPFEAVCTATVMIAAFSTILMGLYANNPIVLAPGMGMNAFFAFSVVLGQKIPPEVALGIIFWSGTLITLLSLLKVREKIIAFIPHYLRHAISCGIGLFIAFIGFINGGVVVDHPVTLVDMAQITPMLVSFFLCLVVTAFFVLKDYKGSLVLGILFSLLVAVPFGRWYGPSELVTWKGLIAMPDFSLFGRLDLGGSFKLAFIPTIFAFMFTDLFDSISTLVGVMDAGKMVDENGSPRNMKRSLIVDALSSAFSPIFGTSPGTSFIESAAGVQQGARTGLSSVFAGLLFLPFLFFSPLLSMFPSFATAPVLVIVGIFMMGPIAKIDWQRMELALPAFLTVLLIPLTFSIAQGMIAGLACHYVIWGLGKLRGRRA